MTANRPGNGPGSENDVALGYYGLPVIHHAHWKWHIVAYMFLGGMSGTSAALAACAQFAGGRAGARLATTATAVSFVSLLPCPILLILDLGRPARFLNMVRVFRPSSPMSVGSWGLMGFSTAISLATALQLARHFVPLRHRSVWVGLAATERVVSTLAGIGGLFLAGYTGTLLAATAVPLWSRQPALLGPLFLSSAAASGTAAVGAIVALGPEPDPELEEGLRRLECLVGLAEGIALTAWLYALGPTARPLMRGRLAPLTRRGVAGAGVTLPLILGAVSTLLPRPLRRAATVVSATLTLVGGYSLRFVVIHGGRESADDPHATFELTQ